MNEFDDLLDESGPNPDLQGESGPEPLTDAEMQSLPREELDARLRAQEPPDTTSGLLVRASQLLTVEEDQSDFEPGGLYKGFRILPESLWPSDQWTPAHGERFPHRFYVETPSGTAGLVPWAGSQVIWPWERAWSVDRDVSEVESFLKEDEKKQKKR